MWDLCDPRDPLAVLVSEGVPSCCCWMGGAEGGGTPFQRPDLVAAGMEEGGLCLWDLREAASSHPVERVGKRDVAGRRPSFR